MAHEYCENCKKAVDIQTYDAIRGRSASGKAVHFCSMSCCRNYQQKHGEVEVLEGGRAPGAGKRVSDTPVGRGGGGWLWKVLIAAVILLLAVLGYLKFFGKVNRDLRKALEEETKKMGTAVEKGLKTVK